MVATAAKMALDPHALTLTVTEPVERAVQRGMEKLHQDLQVYAQRITQPEEWISSLEDEVTAQSPILTRKFKINWTTLKNAQGVIICTLLPPLKFFNTCSIKSGWIM